MILYYNIKTAYTLKAAYKKMGKLLSAKDLSQVKNAAMLVDKDGKITWLGKEVNLKKDFKITQRVDLKQQSILPAFIDCHTHIVFAGNRAKEFELRNQGASYQAIAKAGGGIVNTVKQTRKATKQELISLAQKRVDRFIKQGLTTIEAKSGYGLNLKTEKKILEVNKALKKARIISTYLGPHALPPEHKNLDTYLEQIITKDLEAIFTAGLACRADIFVEKNYFTKIHLNAYIQKVKSLKMDLTIHADQMSSTEVVELAIKHHVRSLDHLVYIKDKEMAALAKSNITAVMLPIAEKYIHIPFPPARKLLKQGVRLALSTDFNPGSAPSQDLSFLGVLARLDLKMHLHEVIAGLTINAAFALGLEKELGSLEKNKWADFITTEAELEDFFYSVGQHPVKQVYSKGKKLV